MRRSCMYALYRPMQAQTAILPADGGHDCWMSNYSSVPLRIQRVHAPEMGEDLQEEYNRCLKELERHPDWYNGYRLVALGVEDNELQTYHADYARTRLMHQNPQARVLGLGSVWAGVLFYNQQGQVLLARRADGMGSYAGMWALPCTGGLRRDESPRHAIHREIVEEWGPSAKPGMAIQQSRFLATIWNPEQDGLGVGFVWSALVAEEKYLRPDPGEIAEWQFFDPDQIPLECAPDLGRLVELWQNQ